jgi:signal transduction histidine kinase
VSQGLDVAEEAGRIGHDLNNCLGVVSGRAELMRMHLERGNAEGVRKGIEAILGQMERMKELSDALRELRGRFAGPPGS